MNTLAQIMTDPDSPAHTKVSAATAILRLGREGIELEDLAARIDDLERMAVERVSQAGVTMAA